MSETEINYYDPALSIRFTENPKDPPDGYLVELMNDSFYLPSRCLDDFTRPNISTNGLIRMLINTNDMVPNMLERSNVSADQFHIAILKLGLLRTKKERDYFMDQIT